MRWVDNWQTFFTWYTSCGLYQSHSNHWHKKKWRQVANRQHKHNFSNKNHAAAPRPRRPIQYAIKGGKVESLNRKVESINRKAEGIAENNRHGPTKNNEREHHSRQGGPAASQWPGGAVGNPPSIWTHLDEEDPRDGQAGNFAATPFEVQDTNVLGMPLRQSNQETLEKQAQEERQWRRQANETGPSRIRWPTRLTDAKADCSDDQIPNHKAL